MLVTEFSVLSNIGKKNKDYLVWTTILLGISLVALLISLVWGTQYLYGGLLGIAGVAMTTFLTVLGTEKYGVMSSWLVFILKIGVFATIILTPVYTINLQSTGDMTLATTLTPINIWAGVVIMGSIPILSSFTVDIYINSKNKILNKRNENSLK